MVSDKLLALVDRYLFAMGASQVYKGYPYVRSMIAKAIVHREYLQNIMMLYADIAGEFGGTWHAVERNIRTFFHNTWDFGNQNWIKQLCGHYLTACPCNSQFLSCIVSAICLKEHLLTQDDLIQFNAK